MGMRLPLRLFKVMDSSMEPGFKMGDYLIVSGLHGRVQEGDVVMLKHPYRKEHLVKRVKSAENRRYYVTSDNDTVVGEDSREFGHVGDEHIVGKVLFKW